MADKSILIRIGAKNDVGPGVKSAKDDLAGLKKELKNIRMDDRAMRFNFGAALEDMVKGALGKFGAGFSAVMAGFAGGWEFGKWLRDFEIGGMSIGKALDKMLVPAKEVFKSISQLTKERMVGFKESIDASRASMDRLAKSSQDVVDSIGAVREAEQTRSSLETERKIQTLRQAEAPSPERAAKEKAIRAEGDIVSAGQASIRAFEVISERRRMQIAIEDEIVKRQAEIVAYQRESQEAQRAQLDLQADENATLAEREQAIARRKSAEEKIVLTQREMLSLQEKLADATVAVQRAKNDQEKAEIAIVKAEGSSLEAQEESQSVRAKAEGDRLKAETENVEKLKDAQGVVEEIAAKQSEIAKEDAGKKLADNLARARRDAEALQDALSKREATGAVGSREQRAAATAEGRRMREIDRMVQERDAVGLPAMTRDRAKGLSDQQISEQRKMARLLKRLGISDAEGMSASDIEETAAKRGVGISDSAREILGRTMLEARLSMAKEEEAKMEAAQKRQNELEDVLNRKNQLIELRKMNQKLETLLQAS